MKIWPNFFTTSDLVYGIWSDGYPIGPRGDVDPTNRSRVNESPEHAGLRRCHLTSLRRERAWPGLWPTCQATLIAGSIIEALKLPLSTRFLAFYLIGRAKTGISSLVLMRQTGVKYRTVWLIHNKIMQTMCERDEVYLLRGKMQIDDAYLGG